MKRWVNSILGRFLSVLDVVGRFVSERTKWHTVYAILSVLSEYGHIIAICVFVLCIVLANIFA